jgi:hypothetical protein
MTILCLFCLESTWQTIRLFPYEYTYFNPLAGGLKSAGNSFDSEYWATSLKEATEELEEYTNKNNPGEVVSVFAANPAVCSFYFFPETFKFEKNPQAAQYSISFTRLNMHKRYPGKTIISIERDGHPFAVVKENTSTK